MPYKNNKINMKSVASHKLILLVLTTIFTPKNMVLKRFFNDGKSSV